MIPVPKNLAVPLFLLGVLWSFSFAAPGAWVSAAEPFRTARVRVGLLPVYSDTHVTSGIVKFLKRGDRVEVLAETVVTDSKWCSVRESARAPMLGFVNCLALEFSPEEKKDAAAQGKKPPPVVHPPEEPKSPARPVPRKSPKETKDPPPYGEFLQVLWKEDVGRVREMLQRGIDPNKPTSFGTRPLLIASKKKNPELLKVLMENGAGVDGKDGNGLTALMAASSMGFPANVRLLITAGADVNARDLKGLTPLMWATVQGHPQIVEILLAHGAEVQAKTGEGLTALRMSQRIVANLKSSPAEGQKGSSPELISKRKKDLSRHEQVLRLLEKAGGGSP